LDFALGLNILDKPVVAVACRDLLSRSSWDFPQFGVGGFEDANRLCAEASLQSGDLRRNGVFGEADDDSGITIVGLLRVGGRWQMRCRHKQQQRNENGRK